MQEEIAAGSKAQADKTAEVKTEIGTVDETLSSTSQDLSKKIEALEARLEAAGIQAGDGEATIQDRLDTLKTAMQEEIAAGSKAQADKTAAIEAEIGDVDKKQAEQITKLEGEMVAMQAEHGGGMQASDELVAKQSQEIEDLQSSIAALKETCATIESLKSLQEQSDANKAACESLNEYIDTNNAAVDAFKAQIEALLEGQEQLKKANEKGDIPEELGVSSAQLEELSTKADSALFHGSENKSALAKAQTKLDELSAQADAFDTFMNERAAELKKLELKLEENETQDGVNREETKQYFVQNGSFLEMMNKQLQEVREKVT